MPTADVMAAIADARVVAILRADDAGRTADVARTLVASGITCVEVTLTTPGALAAIAALAADLPDGAVLGAGTVLDAEDADRAVAAGASFLISPTVEPEVAERARAADVPVMLGAATPTEVLAAWRAGATAVKVFPAAHLGGPGYLQALHGPLPEVPLVPTGGIGIDAARDYLRAGAVAVGVGGPLLGDALAGGSLDDLTQRARRLLDAVAGSGAGR